MARKRKAEADVIPPGMTEREYMYSEFVRGGMRPEWAEDMARRLTKPRDGDQLRMTETP